MCASESSLRLLRGSVSSFEMTGGIDQLHLAATVLRLAVGDEPQISINSGVVEQLGLAARRWRRANRFR